MEHNSIEDAGALTILGSTGSIGKNALTVAQALGLPVAAVAARSNIELLEQQARRFSVRLAAVWDETAAETLRIRLADTDIRVVSGMAGLVEAVRLDGVRTVLSAVSGSIGLLPALEALEAGRRLALANKETLVCAGHIFMRRVRELGAELIPVDSEHSAIFQCLQGGGAVRRLIITASGGPFRGRDAAYLETVTVADALRHPNWSMGRKITVDSATLMNKGLEFIEAMHLFSVAPDDISILVHPQSIVHSMVEFPDGAVLAQLGAPDMKLPIQYALTYPQRVPGAAEPLDFRRAATLTFEEPDEAVFKCLPLAKAAARRGDGCCAALNAANEEAVAAFLASKIRFTDIYRCCAETLEHLGDPGAHSIEEVLAIDNEARRYVGACISSLQFSSSGC